MKLPSKDPERLYEDSNDPVTLDVRCSNDLKAKTLKP